jgi:hypothetical protein
MGEEEAAGYFQYCFFLSAAGLCIFGAPPK